MLKSVLAFLREQRSILSLPAAAKAELRRDIENGLGEDPGLDASLGAALDWLCEAQDRSTSADGGVARHYSLVTGWSDSYPETTGYIVPTLIEAATRLNRPDLRDRARRMADWLVSIQLPDGGFQGGTVREQPIVSVTFNTGQILLGLAAAVAEFGDAYRPSLERAADFLVNGQDPDGCWRKHPTPFAAPGEKSYETHVAWGLFEAERVAPGRGYAESAIRNLSWALGKQRDNGWFDACCLMYPDRPLTHTIGYALRGVLEAHRFTRDSVYLDAARRTADGLLSALEREGFLPGRLDSNWKGTVRYACLTGSVQLAACWFMLYASTGELSYRNAALSVNTYVRRTIRIDGPADVRGAIKGAFPVNGKYGSFKYLNWASKFFIESHLAELALHAAEEDAAAHRHAKRPHRRSQPGADRRVTPQWVDGQERSA